MCLVFFPVGYYDDASLPFTARGGLPAMNQSQQVWIEENPQ